MPPIARTRNAELRYLSVGATGDYSLFASVKGYSLPKKPISVTKKGPDGSTETVAYAPGVAPPFSLDHDIDGYIIKLEPEK